MFASWLSLLVAMERFASRSIGVTVPSGETISACRKWDSDHPSRNQSGIVRSSFAPGSVSAFVQNSNHVVSVPSGAYSTHCASATVSVSASGAVARVAAAARAIASARSNVLGIAGNAAQPHAATTATAAADSQTRACIANPFMVSNLSPLIITHPPALGKPPHPRPTADLHRKDARGRGRLAG